MNQGVWIDLEGQIYQIEYLETESIDIYKWISDYNYDGKTIGRANYHHTLAIF